MGCVLMSYAYVWEKFFATVDRLASGNDSIQERLINAVTFNLLILQNNDFPEDDLREEYEKLVGELNKEQAVGEEGTLRATIEKMPLEESSKIASKIVSMFAEICERGYAGRI